jgi:iron complex transport system substrate-binding protein
VAKREDLATVGVNSYLSPGMCATKKAAGDMYGSRQKLWNMTLLYKEIEDFAAIFNVQSRGEALIADFKKRENDLRKTFSKNKKDLSFVFWFSSSSPSADAYVGGKTAPLGLSPTFSVDITPSPPKPNGRRWAGKALSPRTPM